MNLFDSPYDNVFGDLIEAFGVFAVVLAILALFTFAGFLFRGIGSAFDTRGETFDEMPLFLASLLAVLTVAVVTLLWSAFIGGRTGIRNIILFLALIAGLGWLFRYLGQRLTSNAPRFRDMPYGVAFGYVLGGGRCCRFGLVLFPACRQRGRNAARQRDLLPLGDSGPADRRRHRVRVQGGR